MQKRHKQAVTKALKKPHRWKTDTAKIWVYGMLSYVLSFISSLSLSRHPL